VARSGSESKLINGLQSQPATSSSSNSTCRALIVVPQATIQQQSVAIVDPTFYDEVDSVSLPTRLDPLAVSPLTPRAPLKAARPTSYTDAANFAAPQHQHISEARPVFRTPTISNDTTTTANVSFAPQQSFYQSEPETSSTNCLQDLDDIPTLFFGESHDEYASSLLTVDNDFTDPSSYNTTLYNYNPTDPFVESAAVPTTIFNNDSMMTSLPEAGNGIPSEEEILANVDVDLLCDLEKDVDIGQLMRYLQDDEVMPG
jgi:hypothetical protein